MHVGIDVLELSLAIPIPKLFMFAIGNMKASAFILGIVVLKTILMRLTRPRAHIHGTKRSQKLIDPNQSSQIKQSMTAERRHCLYKPLILLPKFGDFAVFADALYCIPPTPAMGVISDTPSGW